MAWGEPADVDDLSMAGAVAIHAKKPDRLAGLGEGDAGDGLPSPRSAGSGTGASQGGHTEFTLFADHDLLVLININDGAVAFADTTG